MRRFSPHRWSFALFRGRCVHCQLPSTGAIDLCAGCFGALPRPGAGCLCCAVPLATGGICGRCLAEPPPFSRVLAPFLYAEPLDTLIPGLKYRGDLAAGQVLATLLAEYLDSRLAPAQRPDLVMPVPLHWTRQLSRGFNQARELARIAAAELGLPMSRPGLVHRDIATPPQEALGRGERLRNLRRAFRLSRPLTGESVAIVDDVVTTTSTVRVLAKTLLDGGASDVQVWALARTPLEKTL